MFSALLYLQFQTVKNRLWERIRRLRRPRYLFGALAGGLYLLLVFGRPLLTGSQVFGGPHGMTKTPPLPEVPAGVWEFAVACALLVLTALAWIVPRERAALVFTEAEIAFLFPAPIRRQTLIHYKLLRSQLAVLFTVFFLTLFTRWSGGLAGALMRAAGWWILLSTINLHLLGASFVRTSLLEHGVTAWRRRGVILLILLALGFAAVRWARGAVPPLDSVNLNNFSALTHYVSTLANSPPAHWLLLPFRVVVRPFLASGDVAVFGAAVGPALALLALHYLWVLRSDVAFEEASIAVSQRHAARVAAMRSGNWQNTRPARKRRAPFRLAPTGSPAVAILWKNLVGAGQFFNARLALAMLVWSGIVGSTIGSSLTRGRGAEWPLFAGLMCLLLLAMSLLFGSQFVRQDFRRDLLAADLLKIYPMTGWQVALGELLAPAVILTAVQWVLLVLATTLLSGATAHELPRLLIPQSIAVAVLCPTFNLVSLLIPNAAALLLPAWFVSDNQGSGVGSRGIEVIGQRLLFLVAQLLTLAVALVPAALAFFVVTFFGGSYLPAVAVTPLSAAAASLVFAVEAAGGLALLGHWFEQYDLSLERT